MWFRFKLVYIPQIFILLLFLVLTVLGIHRYCDFVYVSGNDIKWPVDPHYGNMFLSSYVLPSLILFFPLFGIFFKRELGWFLASSYFYSVLVGAVAATYFDIKFGQPYSLSITSLFTLLIATLIYIMNKPKVFMEYRIKKKNLLALNLFCFIIGSILSLITVIKNNQHFYDVF